jgi:hypothetical protein
MVAALGRSPTEEGAVSPRPLLFVVLGVLLLVVPPVAWYLSQPADAVGDIDAWLGADDGSPLTDAPPEPTPEPDPAPDPQDEPAVADAADATGEDAPSSFTVTELRGPIVTVPAPDTIALPALGVRAPVVPVALEDDGSMEIPEDVSTVGWFAPGVRPGQDGSAVISGHVDSRVQGRGAFFELGRLDVGDEVVIGAGSSERRFEVVARQRYGKAELPIAELFTREGPPRLVLITCGGAFDPATRSYAENIVVVTVPVDG